MAFFDTINLQSKLRNKFLKKGVKMIAPETVFLTQNTKIRGGVGTKCQNF